MSVVDHKFFSPDLYIQKAETSIKLHEKIIAFHLIPEDGKCIIDISTVKQGDFCIKKYNFPFMKPMKMLANVGVRGEPMATSYIFLYTTLSNINSTPRVSSVMSSNNVVSIDLGALHCFIMKQGFTTSPNGLI